MPRAEPAATESAAERLEPLLDGGNDEGEAAEQAQGGSNDCEEGGWSPDGLCVVCFEEPRGAALRCGHDDFCATCAPKFDTCPLCRESTGRVRPAAEGASPGSDGGGPRRRLPRHGDMMRHRGSATCFAAMAVLMVYALVLYILSAAGVDIRCRGFPLVPDGVSEATCVEEFGDKYGQCVQGMCLMAPAYVLSKCSENTRPLCGTYLRMEKTFCQGAPVYLKNGQDGAEVLFRWSPDDFSDVTKWAIGPNRDITFDCTIAPSIYMLSGGSIEPNGPDYIGYLPWYLPPGATVVVHASDGRSDPQGLCKGVECGDYSYCTADHNGMPLCKCKENRAGADCEISCGEHGTSNGFTCSCSDGYIGPDCQSALPAGFHSNYALTGCMPMSPHAGTSKCDSECLCGNFTRTLRTCDGAPVYWRHPEENSLLPPGVTDSGAFLFRVVFNNRSRWITSSLVAVESCNPFYNGGLQSHGAALALTQSPATRLEVPAVVGAGLTAGPPDDQRFKPWSTCNTLDKCVVMSDFQITAI